MENEALHSNLGRNMRYLRLKHGLTKKAMAELLGIGVGSVRRIETGEFLPRVSRYALYRIADVFHVSMDALLRTDMEREAGQA